VLNVIVRVVTNILAARLAPVAQATINPCQTGFIKGRFIHAGIVIIEEVLHALRTRNSLGIFLKLDYKRHTIGSLGSSWRKS
jgi:hypothetical protein